MTTLFNIGLLALDTGLSLENNIYYNFIKVKKAKTVIT